LLFWGYTFSKIVLSLNAKIKFFIMINDLLHTIKGELTNQLARKTDLNQEKVNSASTVVTETFKDGLAERAKQGKLDDILGLLSKDGATSGFANSLISSTISNLVAKVGLPQNVANQIASFAVPFIVNKLGNFASAKGQDNKEGVQDLLGDLLKGSVKDKLLGGLGKKFGF